MKVFSVSGLKGNQPISNQSSKKQLCDHLHFASGSCGGSNFDLNASHGTKNTVVDRLCLHVRHLPKSLSHSPLQLGRGQKIQQRGSWIEIGIGTTHEIPSWAKQA